MKVNQCHLCKSENLDLVLSLAPTPPANEFVSDLNGKQECFPLDLYKCNACQHFQLLDIVDPERLFKNYVYVSGTSPVFIKHFEDYATSLISQFKPEPNSLVVDIGSNDGTLLQQFKNHSMRVVGVDPAEKIASEANAKGIETVCSFFNQEVAKDIVSKHGKAKIITCNNCFAHIPDLNEIVLGMKELLDDDGKIIIEVQYFGDMLKHNLFDMIYHEHIHYWTITSLNNYINKYQLQVFRTEMINTHGGSERFYIQKKKGSLKSICSDPSMDDLLKSFKSNIEKIKEDFLELMHKVWNETCSYKEIVGFGAPAKFTTLSYYFGLNRNCMNYVCDDSPWKQGLYTPGHDFTTHFPVVPASKLYEDQPKYCIIFAWNFAESIIEKCRKNGYKGKFIVPLPTPRIIE